MYTQDYEMIWDRYSENFEKLGKNVEHLGDEWGTPEKTMQRFNEYIEPYLDGVTVVGELGVGGGKYSILVADHVKKIYGIDISTKMLERTAERLKDYDCLFVPAKCENSSILLPDESLEVFYSIDSMVHIFPYELYLYILEIGRILKPGGLAIIEFADWDLPASIEKFKMDVEVFNNSGKLGSGAFGFISREAMKQFSGEAGLEVIDIVEITSRSSIARLGKPKSTQDCD